MLEQARSSPRSCKGASAINFLVAASVQHQSEFDSSNDTGVNCRTVWRVRHNRQELERLSGRISAILLMTELGSGAIRRHAGAEAGTRSAEYFYPGKILPAVQGLY